MKNYAEPIKNIKVIDRKNSNKLDFKNRVKNGNLGYIVKNSVIKSIILKSINLKKNIQLINLVKLTNIYQKKNLVLSESDNLRINSKLLIAADGKNSFVRNYIKTPVFKKNYTSSRSDHNCGKVAPSNLSLFFNSICLVNLDKINMLRVVA